jgi:uncharacterized protein YdhG (YjbR/CyaY superfamily)
MKKILLMAFMMAATSGAFAQDAVKKAQALLKSNDFKGAIEAIQPALNQGTAQDKAAAWNMLADINYQQYSNIYDEIMKNKTLGKAAPYDTATINKASIEALKAASECYKYDIQPNEKGKVKPKFSKDNAVRMVGVRNYLLTVGNDAYNSKDYKTAFDGFGLFVESSKDPLFAESKLDNSNLAMVSYYTMLAAYFDKNNKGVIEFADKAMGDTADVKTVIELKAAAYQNIGDTVSYVKTLEVAHAKFPDADNYFEWLMNYYLNKGNAQVLQQFADKEASVNPNSKFTFYAKGVAAEFAKNWDAAVDAYKKAVDIDAKYANATYNAGRALLQKANEIRNDQKLGAQATAKSNPYIKESIKYLEMTKQLLPDRKDLWAYLLQTAYYAVGDNAKSAEYEKLTKE